MELLRGQMQGYDADRMVVQFTMLNQGAVIQCAISSAAMDIIENARGLKSDQRTDQFLRLRDVIEERASFRFFEDLRSSARTVILRSNDFQSFRGNA